MKISGNEVLITGGATGIGFALADAFLTHIPHPQLSQSEITVIKTI